MRIRLDFSKPKSMAITLFLATFFLGANQAAAKEYIVKLAGSQIKTSLKQLSGLNTTAFRVAGLQKSAGLIKVDVRNDFKGDAKTALMKRFKAEYVVENTKMFALLQPNDPRRSEQWALDTINADSAWDTSFGSQSVVVSVIDTGLDASHEDLKSNVWTNPGEIAGDGIDNDSNGYIDDVHGWDFYGNDNDANDETGAQNPGHGTHCSGIIGAACNNDVGICGISPLVSLMPLRFLGSDGSGDLFAATTAIEYAQNNGANIISASWGAAISRSEAQPLIDAIAAAEQAGLIFVAAASNDGENNDFYEVYPANAQTPHMISVAASDSNDQKPYWSNYGRRVDLAAPGDGILSSIPGGYQELSGTSMATPLVAGLVALLKSIDATLTGQQARSILQSTGVPVEIQTASNRRIDANAAILAVSSKQLTVVPAAATFSAGDEFDFAAWGGSGPYTFASDNPEIATITNEGHLVAVSDGTVVIGVTDANGNTASSVSIQVGHSADYPPDNPSTCPIGDEFICEIICIIWPDAPWCDSSESTLILEN